MPGMTHEAFAAKLTDLLPKAQANPTAYRRRVQAWVWLGYGFIALLLLGSFALLGGLLWAVVAVGVAGIIFKLLIPVVYFVWTLLRSLWVKFDPPAGRELSRAEAAPLHDLLRAQTRALRAPAVHRVILTTDFNAAAMQLPRLGLLGWPRNYVLVGLPLLQTLTPEQAAAVVAHELGHLRGGHGRFAALTYRVNQSWAQLVGNLEQSGRRSIVRGFTEWYVPRFNAWSHPLRRTAEFEADAAAARITSPAALAGALCAIEVREPALDQLYWTPLNKSLAVEPAPPADPISRLLAVARTASLPAEEESALLRRAAEADPDPFDTHPTLGERLAALGQPVAAPAPPATTAAEAWLGASLPALAQELDTKWRQERASFWRERHAVLRDQLSSLNKLNEQLAGGTALAEADAWTHADLTEDHVSEAESLPLYRALFDSAKYGAPARFAVGRILASQDDPAGLPLLEEAMRSNPDFVGPGLAIQQGYHQRQGDRDAARQLASRQYHHADFTDLVAAERQGCTQQDVLLAHGLSDEELAPVLAVLADPANRVGRAWLMRKQLTHLAAEKPYFILVLRADKGKGLNTDEEVANWASLLTPKIVLPSSGLAVPIINEFMWVGKKALALAGSEIYHRQLS
ncbi:M48 family metallopeptidase [Hymenobacter cheonanensis]|uniref:M48 family metallopeptidase n=1 Tax=Hymenobacter sp. CA2-7 TaxID=3063993 RepID=UPI00271378C3|nr:M48 family metallopeptidase [Hymenobacter sp. CA2-7]MDO7884722.1 M48 family metalloprotease [Hymenobacter sp. CA2-7]